MGYSLLPILLSLACRPLRSLVATPALGGLIFALDIALSVHYLFIAGLLLVIVVSCHSSSGRRGWSGRLQGPPPLASRLLCTG